MIENLIDMDQKVSRVRLSLGAGHSRSKPLDVGERIEEAIALTDLEAIDEAIKENGGDFMVNARFYTSAWTVLAIFLERNCRRIGLSCSAASSPSSESSKSSISGSML